MRLGLQPRLSMLSVLAWCRSPNALSDTVPLGHTVQVRCGSVPHSPPAFSVWSVCRSCGNPDIADTCFTVNAVVYRYEAHALFGEHDVCVKADF